MVKLKKDKNDVTPPFLSPNKLLSHRFRGFSEMENSLQGMINALQAGVKNIEFDIRVTADNQLIAHHDPDFVCPDGTRRKVRDCTLEDIVNMMGAKQPVTLERLVLEFSRHKQEDTIMHIDIKDEGFEKEVLSICEQYASIDNFMFVSWIPTVLMKIHDLNSSCTLCYSHISFNRYPNLYSAFKFFSRTQSLAKSISKPIRGVKLHFDDTGTPEPHLDEKYRIGYNHGHIVPNIVNGEILEILKNCHGMVCIPYFCLSKDLLNQYRKLHIKVAVFSIKSRSKLFSLERKYAPDLYYVDEASIF